MRASSLVALAAILGVVAALLFVRWPSTHAQPVASITLPPPGTEKSLYPGCNNVTLTFPDATSSTTVVEAASPAGSIETMWQHNAAAGRWEGFASVSPAASDLLDVDFLDAVWLCVGGPAAPAATATPPSGATPGATVTQPPVTTGTAPAGATATATPGPAGATATPTSTPAPGTTPEPTPTVPPTVSAAVAPTDALSSFHYRAETTLSFGGGLEFKTRSEGDFKSPNSFTCKIESDVLDMTTVEAELVAIGPDAWMKNDGGWTQLPAGDDPVAQYIRRCPGSAQFWANLDVPDDLSAVQGQSAFVNGVNAVRLSLEDFVETLPFLSEPLSVPGGGVTVQNFDMWLAQDGGWVVAMEYDIVFPGGDGEDFQVHMRVDVTSPNDPSISVDPPP